MSKMTLLSAVFFLLQYYNTSSKKLLIDNVRNDITQSTKFWKIYRMHFILSKTLTVTLLQVDNYKPDLRQFSDTAIRRMYSYGNINMTVKVEEKFLLKYTKADNRPYYNTHEEVDTGRNSSPARVVSLERAIEIKRISSDFKEARLIIVWNEEILQQFLDQDYRIVIPNARALYVILFVFSVPGDCPYIKEKLSNVLVRLWKQYSVLNVIALTPSSCDTNTVYIYRPFYRINETSWGLVRNYTMEEVIHNFGLILNSLWNINRFPIPISMFARRPTAVPKLPKALVNNPIYQDLSFSKGFGGLDGCVLGGIARYLNFDIDIVKQLDNIAFGTVLDNGTVTGSLGDIVYRRAQFSGNGRFLTDYGTDAIEFTVPYSNDYICAVVPKAKRIPQWRMIFKCFRISTWLTIFAMVTMCTLVWYSLPTLQACNGNKPSWWQMYSVFMGIPVKISPTVSQSLVLGACMVFNVIIIGVVQGSLFTSFSTVTYYKDINTLEELDQSGLLIATSLNVLDHDRSELIKSLHSKKINLDDALEMIAAGWKLATLQRKNDVTVFVKINYIKNGGVTFMNVVNECVTSYFIAYILPKGSPFLMIFNHVIAKFVESGLTLKWYHDVQDSVIMENMFTLRLYQDEKPFSLQDVQAAFYVLIFGILLALVIFTCEMLFVKKPK